MPASSRFQPVSASLALKSLATSLLLCLVTACAQQEVVQPLPEPPPTAAEIILDTEIARLDRKLQSCLSAGPVTITSFPSKDSSGGPHDFYSSAPGTTTTEEPFVAHRENLIRFSNIVATLTSSFLISGNREYSDKASQHLRAWFVDPATRMNPNLDAATTANHNAIRDTIHLTEIARSIKVMSAYKIIHVDDERVIRAWFADYLAWLNKHPASGENRADAVAWTMQAAAIADLLGNKAQLAQIRANFKQQFEVVAAEGGFPAAADEGDALFVVDGMATVAQIASTKEDNLWHYRAKDGRGMARAVKNLLPYFEKTGFDKTGLEKAAPADSQAAAVGTNSASARHASLAFAALAYTDSSYLSSWQPLEADPENYQLLSKLPVRHPLLWLPNNLPQQEEVKVAATNAVARN